MAISEGAIFKIIKDILGFNPKKPIDVICLVIVLGLAVYGVVAGLLPLGFILISGFIILYFVFHGLFQLICFVCRKIYFSCKFGWMIARSYKRLSDKEKFILQQFIEADDLSVEFNIREISQIYFDRLVEKKFLESVEPVIPSGDADQLRHALGDSFVLAKMNRRGFDYFTKNHCENAVKLDFIIYRAEIRQYWRSRGRNW